jgi:hypothetical protein
VRTLIRALLAFIVLLCATVAPTAAQAVTGTVRDAGTDRPIPGARLLLLDDAGQAVDSTRADRAGRFRLGAPQAGSYIVYFRMDGWAGVPSEPLRLAAGAPSTLDFRVPLVGTAALRNMSTIMELEPRLQESLPEICGEPFRAWEAGLLVGVVRRRAGGEPVAAARVAVAGTEGVARSTLSSESGVYFLCNVPVGAAVVVTVETLDGITETTDVEIRAGTASWYDLPVGPRRR